MYEIFVSYLHFNVTELVWTQSTGCNKYNRRNTELSTQICYLPCEESKWNIGYMFSAQVNGLSVLKTP